MKTDIKTEYWELIAKYYANECNEHEENKLFKWLDEDENNHKVFNKVKQDLEIINLNKSMHKVNVDSAWDKLKNRIGEDDIVEINSKKKHVKFQLPVMFKYAAAIIIIVGIGFLSRQVYQNMFSIKTELAAFNEQGKEIVLPDGSVVIMNANSKIEYPKSFVADERRVVLEGEAFFDVTKNLDRPFVIELKDAEVKVLGTSFNVNENNNEAQVEVFVETGLVQLSRKKNKEEKILINPGDIGVLTSESIIKDKNKNKNIVAWKTGVITFNEDNISEVIETLNKVYNTNISCNDEDILTLKYTSTFRNQDIESILNVICLTFNLKVEYNDENISIIKHDS